MKTIKEVIVVEGRHDSAKLKQFFDCETIETSGTSVSKEVLERIKQAIKEKGVILFLDPDAPGNKIRQRINDEVPGCKNAFIQKEDGRTSKKVGIEHANEEVLTKALENLVSFEDKKETLTYKEYLELGLVGKSDSKERRMKVGKALHLGYGNAKTMFDRCNKAQLTKEGILKILDE